MIGLILMILAFAGMWKTFEKAGKGLFLFITCTF